VSFSASVSFHAVSPLGRIAVCRDRRSSGRLFVARSGRIAVTALPVSGFIAVSFVVRY
jgi:hypothetical protein